MDDGDEGAAECRDQEFENVQYAQVEEGFACRNTAKKPLDDGATHTEAECADAVANGQVGNLFEFKWTVQLQVHGTGSVCFRYVDPAVKRFRQLQSIRNKLNEPDYNLSRHN